MDAERRARMRMSRIAEPGDADACRLVREFSAVALVERLAAGRASQPKAQAWADRLAGADVDVMLRAAERVSATYLIPGDERWAVELADLAVLESAAGDRRAGEPFGLWVRGPLALSELPSTAVAIVGARASTVYGDHVAGALAAGCAAHDRPVISGGAYGIDAAAHRGALAGDGATVAVLASGIDRLYPTGHAGLLDEVAVAGLLVSEAAPGCRTEPVALPGQEPADRRVVAWNRRGGGCPSQRLAEHGPLGPRHRPRRDGRPWTGHLDDVGRRPRAAAPARGCARHRRRRGAGAGVARRLGTRTPQAAAPSWPGTG